MSDAAPEAVAQERRSLRQVLAEHPAYARYAVCQFLSIVGWSVLSVSVGWIIADRTGDPEKIAYVGLAQFVPAVICSTWGGVVADRNDRRQVLSICYAALAVLVAALGWLFMQPSMSLSLFSPFYVLLGALGVTRAFAAPAGRSIVPSLVARRDLGRAVSFSSVLVQVGMLSGPAVAGVVYGRLEGAQAGQGAHVFSVCVVVFLVVLVMLRTLPPVKVSVLRDETGTEALARGARYVIGNKPVLGALSLDLFAVFLGGAVALFPLYGTEILHVGPEKVGLMRSMQSIGAACMALFVVVVPIQRRAGLKMFAAVFLFGVGTVVFACSTSYALSLAALFVVGAADMISVVVRSTLIQLWTPDEMRGRVSALDSVFVMASNEFGEFRAGMTAKWFGLVPAAALGGIGSCVVVMVWMWLFPSLRKTDSLEKQQTLGA